MACEANLDGNTFGSNAGGFALSRCPYSALDARNIQGIFFFSPLKLLLKTQRPLTPEMVSRKHDLYV
jgi:hypothetical protein